MPRILVFNATPSKAEERIVTGGSKSYDRLITEALERHRPAGAQLQIFSLRVADGERLPQGLGLGDFDGVWISGSPFNVYKLDQPTVRDQIALTQAIWDQGIPAFGSCFGLQLMTAALGGTVALNPKGREIGLARRIFPTSDGRAHALFKDKPLAFDAPCSHEDEVTGLPACATLLASNEFSRVQAAAFREAKRSFWGVQYHPEFELSTIASIIALRATAQLEEGLVRSPEELDRLVADFHALSADPGRKDLAWRYGIGPDILDPAVRTREFDNWLASEVMPFAAKRAG